MNTLWKLGFAEGFAAGWEAAKKQPQSRNKYETMASTGPVGPAEYNSTISLTNPPFSISDYAPAASPNKTVKNLTDHTLVV